MSKDRLYSDQEFSAILRRAGEMQATKSVEETVGLSLEDIQQIAGEAGFDPAIIAAAAAEIEEIDTGEKAEEFLGVPTSQHIEKVLPGEISEALYLEVASKISEAFGKEGKATQLGSALEWTYKNEQSNLRVTVMPHKGQTKLRVNWNHPHIYSNAMLPIIVVSLLPAFFAFSGPGLGAISITLLSIGLAFAFLLFHGIFTDRIRKNERDTKKLMRNLNNLIFRLQGVKVPAPVTAKPQLEIPEAEEEFNGTEQAGRVRDR